ncbi:protease HtpX [bacterium DOLZORAL124_38_8]|nr:MAG: protease HtpX [bacterium DOLZORAL124_38_8]
MKRMFLFGLVNIVVVLVVSMIAALFGLTGDTSNLFGLAIFCLLWGSVGSLISLFMSKWLAKKSFGITPIQTPVTASERLVYSTVQRIAQQEGITMPEVGIYRSATPNAFATGASKNASLVAVSTGLIDLMEDDEIEAVIGHEMAHVVNGDMVTMALVQGVVNAFVLFAANIFSRDEDGRSFLLYYVLQIVFGVVANILVVFPFSRYREFRADAGSAKFLGRTKMIRALQKLQTLNPKHGPLMDDKKMAVQAFFGLGGSWMATHPSLEKRIEALKKLN